MPTLRNRFSAAWNALIGGSPGIETISAATVREYEAGNQLSRYRQSEAWQLVRRYTKYIKVAQSRNASAVAGAPLRVYKQKRGGRKTAFDTRPVSWKELKRQRLRGSKPVRKAADMSDEVDEIVDPYHPLVRLLADANALDNGFGLLEQTQLAIGLTGNAYWYMVAGKDGKPAELWPLPPQYVHPIPSREMMIEGYIYGRSREIETRFDASQVLRFSQPNPRGDPFKGYGDLEACLDDADLSVAISQFRLTTIDNGAQPGVILVAKTAGADQRQQLEDQFNRKFSGVSKAGRTAVLTGEVTVSPWGMTEKEVAFLNSDASIRETIANCHDMSSALLTLDSAALATAEAAIPQWQEQAILPRCRRIESTICQGLVPLFGDDLYVCFDEVVQKNIEKDTANTVSLYSSGIITQNEARDATGYDHVEGGDDFIGPVFPRNVYGQPVPTTSEFPTEQTPTGDTVASAPPTDGAAPTDEQAPKADAPKKNLSQKDVIFGHGPDCACCHRPPKSFRKTKGEETISMTEKELEEAVANWFGHIAQTMSGNVGSNGLKGSSVPLALSFTTATTNTIGRIYLTGWNFGVQELGDKAGEATLQSALTGPVEKYLREHELKLANTVSETVLNRVKEELAVGVSQGETITQLKTRLQESVNDMSGIAAERIARTETARAFMAARERSWQASGNVWGKRWQLAPDACDFCKEVAAAYGVQPVGAPFFSKGDMLTLGDGQTMNLDYSDVDGPPLHPNDRCSLVAVYEKPKDWGD